MDECYVNEEKCVQIPAPGPEGEIVPRRNVEIPSHCISTFLLGTISPSGPGG